MYKVKKLKWKKEQSLSWDHAIKESVKVVMYVAYVSGGHYSVKDDVLRDGIYWSWYFTEWSDEGEESCSSVKEGKQKAQEDWNKRVAEIMKYVDLE